MSFIFLLVVSFANKQNKVPSLLKKSDRKLINLSITISALEFYSHQSKVLRSSKENRTYNLFFRNFLISYSVIFG